ncbi:alanine racemase [Actinoalloteichus hymeniacidonis]|uniref:Alanine racemase n=1 Tax=Actinoalloteichus hymeniacidonis TaxID=340345 RepID=A0AAC9HVH0_9PSEU|nr:alanine racemase [Actinoalloteichus hymeniacidonis]AOS65751.1 alanine racemase [Actinoalloteichus hymeniacidonis]MBB5906159.1 alanine racemase [Actinoalloteichus hymeniacidonis]
MDASNPPLSRAELVVDAEAIRGNVALLAAQARRSGAATMAVVKADGYGHGASTAARAALAGGATWLGVRSQAEALALRADGIIADILCWLHEADEDFTEAVRHGVTISVAAQATLQAVVRAARQLGTTADIHLKIDTGLSRNGATRDDWPALVAAAAEAESAGQVSVDAVWSHLACADEPGHPSIDAQAERFDAAYRVACDAGLHPMRHLANSAATLTRPDLHFDLVRPGIACYGLNPVPGHTEVRLRPAMTLRSRVALVKRVPAGEGVSYGLTWTAPRDTTLALVPVGYADGMPRLLSGRMSVWLAGARRPIAGRICMDQFVVDCGDDPVRPGDPVVLFGAGDHGEPTATEWADAIGTIDYEIVTGLYRPRARRHVVDLPGESGPPEAAHNGGDRA